MILRATALAVIAAATTTGVVLVEGGRRVSERDLLRGYAFSRCLQAAYEQTAMGNDAARVAELYRESGRESRPQMYHALDAAARAQKAATPAAKDGANLAVMTCLEFYESHQLAKVIQRPPKAAARAAEGAK